MKFDIHVRHRWPMAPTDHARWEGGGRAYLVVSGYEVNDDGHVCVPNVDDLEVAIPKENVVAITPRKESDE